METQKSRHPGPDRPPLSPISPDASELRRRSSAHVNQVQQDEAATMSKQDAANTTPPAYVGSEPRLTFFQRHFYCSPKNEESDGQNPQKRRFSLLSRGSIVTIGLLCLLVVIIVLCAVLATVYGHRKRGKSGPSPIREAIHINFPDPAIIQHGGIWYAFATNNAAGVLEQPANSSMDEYGLSNVQLATSNDFLNWTVLDSTHDPLPDLGAWVKPTYTNTTPPIPRANVWAPEILVRPSDGKYIMFYSAETRNATRSHCIGAAVSDEGPAGPYTPLDDAISCPVSEGGAIDPVSFIDVDGSIYVAWKIDGNNIGHGGVCGNTVPPLVDTPIMLQKMQSDGVTRDGDPIVILDRTKSDGPLVEAPSLVRSSEGIYFLFFSSGCTRAPSYDLKYAYAHNVTGPYTRASAPLLVTGDWGLLAPGSVGIRSGEDGDTQMAFHARVPSASGRVRAMFTSRLAFNGTTAKLIR